MEMTELNPLKWGEIYSQLVESGDYVTGFVNCHHLTSILDDLYVENQELKSRVETLESDIETLRWDKIRELESQIENLNYKLGTYD
jgi:predicted nuclease with TOPRIM domain